MLRFIPVFFLIFALGAAFLVEKVVKPRSGNYSDLATGVIDPAKLQIDIALAKLNRSMTPELRFDFADYTPAAPEGWEKHPYHISDEPLLTGLQPLAEDKVDADLLEMQKSLARIRSRGNQSARDLYTYDASDASAVSIEIKFVKSNLLDGLAAIREDADSARQNIYAEYNGLIFKPKPATADEVSRTFAAQIEERIEITIVANASDEDILQLIQTIDVAGLRQVIAPPEDPGASPPVETSALPPTTAIARPAGALQLSGAKPANSRSLGGGCSTRGAGKFCKVGSN